MNEHVPHVFGGRLRSLRLQGQLSCARWKNEVFALCRRGATNHFKSLPAGWTAWSGKNTNLPSTNSLSWPTSTMSLSSNWFAPYTPEMPKLCPSSNVPVRMRPCC
jgi:hypothetical protein